MQDEMKEALSSLLGKKVVKIEEFATGSFDEGYIITFEDGKRLTAQDGEYGDNAFCFLTNKEYKDKIERTKKAKIMRRKFLCVQTALNATRK